MSALIRMVCALALAAAATLTLTGAADASGSLCATKGVDVVVDYGSLGGGAAEGCATQAASTADKAFDAAGYQLQYVPDQPGFVCAVAGKPAQCKMPGSGDPWWGLFYSNGKTGTWKMAPVAVTKLKVPANGAVAMVWESGKKVAKPSVAAPTASDRQTARASAKPVAAKSSTAASTSSGVPVWVPIVVVLVLLAGGGAVALRRRGTAS